MITENTLQDEAEDEAQASLIARVCAFGESLTRRRNEAITGRKASGIEDDWLVDEDSYQGIDDANRSTMVKPASANGSFTTASTKVNRVGSSVFLNITRPYVDAAAARVADMLLPNDETNWDIRPTPLPAGNFKPVAKAVQQVANAGPAGQPNQLPDQPAPQEPVDEMAQLEDQAREACKLAKKQLEDWLVQCQWHAEVRKVVEDSARLGTGILKGPVPSKRMTRAMERSAGGELTMAMHEEIAPESKNINPWNFYPDPACGESIHDGSYTWEKDRITAKQLRALKGMGYIDAQIDKVLAAGPDGKSTDTGFNPANSVADSEKFDIWYYYGTANREDLEAACVEIPEDGDVSVAAIVTMVNDEVIKAALNPLDSGEFPYDVMPWQRRAGMPWGMGVGRQINTPQRMLNSAARNLMDNAAFTAGPQVIVRRGAIIPADGKWELTPRKLWWIADGADVQAAKDAFTTVNIPTMQEQLSNIIQFALKMAEDVTGLPMLMQGSQGTAPDTVGGMTIVNNNANVVLRRIIRTFDDKVTESHIRRYYEYLMMYGKDPAAKGDYQVDARGSTALIERDFQNNEAAQILQMSLNPAFGVSPVKAMQEYLKSRRFDAKRFEPNEEEKRAAASQEQPPIPQVEVAKINAETAMKVAETRGMVELKKEQIRAEGDINEIEAKGQIELKVAGINAEADVYAADVDVSKTSQELQIRWQLAQLEYANKHSMQLADVKKQLAIESSKINLQRELAGVKGRQVLTPPVEPPGRAPDGEAYQA